MKKLIDLDRELFVFLNELHAPWLDQPMYFLSDTLVWLPLYIFLAYFIFKHYRFDSWIILLGITLTIVLSDQITSTIMKPFFARLRPTHDAELQDVVHIVNNYRGRPYGFASSHAANTFGTAMLLFLHFRKNTRWIVLLFFWAAFVSYTRIYLGVHFPGDIIAGAIVGMLCAYGMFHINSLVIRYMARKREAQGLSGNSTTS